MIPVYISLALLNMLLMGVVDFLYGRAVRKEISFATLMCSSACLVFPTTGIWAWLEGNYAWSILALLGAITASLFFVAFWTFIASVRLGELSVSTPIYRINFVVTALIAVLLLDEPLNYIKVIGFLLAGLAIILISDFRMSGDEGRRVGTSSIALALVAMTAAGLLNVVFKIGVSKGLPPTMFIHSNALFFTSLCFGYAFATQGGPKFSKLAWAYGLSSGACLLTGSVALLAALRWGEVSVVTPISQLSFVVSVLLATLWLKEQLTLRKLAGLLLVIGTIGAFSQ